MSLSSLDPWGISNIKDYERLCEEFGVSKLDQDLLNVLIDNKYVRRKIVFGHRDIKQFIQLGNNGQDVAIMSGIKPTGVFHLGNKITVDQIVYFQRKFSSAKAFFSIADLETYIDNGINLKESAKMAETNIADVLAAGIDAKRTIFYRQSEALMVHDLAFIFSRDITFNTFKAIYGERHPGLYFAALVQAGDIFMPQTRPFGGPKRVLVPVGADQDPHIRLSRDISARHQADFKFIAPSAIYHRLVRSLSGDEKMSKRNPLAMITLSDGGEELERKISDAYTGGRSTVEEQRRLGGEPWKCPIYDLYMYFEDNDKPVSRVYDECKGGSRLCGECKQEALELVNKKLEMHREIRNKYIESAKELMASTPKEVMEKPI